MKNRNSSFSLRIGSLKFNTKSLAIVLFAALLMGILVGTYSAIHIDSPDTSLLVTMPVLLGFVIPILILIKGVREAEEVSSPKVG